MAKIDLSTTRELISSAQALLKEIRAYDARMQPTGPKPIIPYGDPRQNERTRIDRPKKILPKPISRKDNLTTKPQKPIVPPGDPREREKSMGITRTFAPPTPTGPKVPEPKSLSLPVILAAGAALYLLTR